MELSKLLLVVLLLLLLLLLGRFSISLFFQIETFI